VILVFYQYFFLSKDFKYTFLLSIFENMSDEMKEKIVKIICDKLENNMSELKNDFFYCENNISTRFITIDDLLPKDLALDIYRNFPSKKKMRLMNSFREKKYTFKQLNETSSILQDITFAFQDSKVVSLIEKITEISGQRTDPSLYAGGISLMEKNNYLNPHIDNSHDGNRRLYRTFNLLYYVTPNWKQKFGGNLELWDTRVKKSHVIPSFFNRLVIMETNPDSWHSVSPVNCDKNRCCVSNYYFSDLSPTGKEYFNITSFNGRPDQKALRFFSKIDNFARSSIRLIFKKGVGKNDIFKPD
jgi:Rps23 Pro-64 3,4-dihydroxylase Tpa1-like proline 4-hydroxylase